MSIQPRILVVEDERLQLEILTYNLEAEGFQVIKAMNGNAALLIVEREEPDLILLDWMLPGLSGIEVCRRLKLNARYGGIPIMMLSARTEELDKKRGLEAGADDYMAKPYSLVELMARLRSQLCRPRSAT